jgi:uncharacterized protein YodC (DUF2158 family)
MPQDPAYLDKDQTEQPPQVPPSQPFAVGDVVTLKSGGPALTVIGCDNGEVQAMIVCQDGKVERVWQSVACFKAAE